MRRMVPSAGFPNPARREAKKPRGSNRPAKTLIVCCDGTWNTPDQSAGPTNVTKIARAIRPFSADGEPQIVHYDQGVGTGNMIDRLLGGALGIGLDGKVQQAYRFLALNYVPGDRIVLLGFSRGAFTVRSLAGLVGLIGLLRKGDLDRMPNIWTYYRTSPKDRDPTTIDPAWIDCRPDIDIVAVWDTVGSLGIPGSFMLTLSRSQYAFHDVTLSRKVKRAYQALAVDEFREDFAPAIWDTTNRAPDQIVEQRWFPGAHSNVGGGYTDSWLSDNALRWICDRLSDVVAFDKSYLKRRVKKLPKGKARGILIDTWAGLFRLKPRFLRTIGKDPTECIDDSVYWRIRARTPFDFEPGPYAPRNINEDQGLP